MQYPAGLPWASAYSYGAYARSQATIQRRCDPSSQNPAAPPRKSHASQIFRQNGALFMGIPVAFRSRAGLSLEWAAARSQSPRETHRCPRGMAFRESPPYPVPQKAGDESPRTGVRMTPESKPPDGDPALGAVAGPGPRTGPADAGDSLGSPGGGVRAALLRPSCASFHPFHPFYPCLTGMKGITAKRLCLPLFTAHCRLLGAHRLRPGWKASKSWSNAPSPAAPRPWPNPHTPR